MSLGSEGENPVPGPLLVKVKELPGKPPDEANPGKPPKAPPDAPGGGAPRFRPSSPN